MTETWAAPAPGASRRKYLGMSLLAVAALGSGPGCDSQADPSYRGEPLLSVAGQVEAALRVGEVEVGILWLTASGEFDLECSGEVVTASGAPRLYAQESTPARPAASPAAQRAPGRAC